MKFEDTAWSIRLYPGGKNQDANGISIYIVSHSNRIVRASYDINIEDIKVKGESEIFLSMYLIVHPYILYS